MLENRFYKVGQGGGSFVTALFYNPVTHETDTVVARDYDYSDCSRDNDEVYYMPIDEAAQEAYRRYLNSVHGGNLAVGDTVEVFKGRKIPHGTIAKVTRIYDWKDSYGRVQTTYAVFADGRKTNVFNCRIVDSAGV